MGLRIPVMAKCCICIPLRIGCLILGYLTVITSCLTLAGISYYIYYIHQNVEASKLSPNPANPPAVVAAVATGMYLNLGLFLAAFLYNAILNVFLVIGTHTNNVKMLKGYCFASLGLVVLAWTLVPISWVNMGILPGIGLFKWGFSLIFHAIIARSAYLEMEAANKPPMQEMNLYSTQRAPLMA